MPKSVWRVVTLNTTSLGLGTLYMRKRMACRAARRAGLGERWIELRMRAAPFGLARASRSFAYRS